MNASKKRSLLLRRVALISIAISITISSTACKTFRVETIEITCHRPNDRAKRGWKDIYDESMDAGGDRAHAAAWLANVLEDDCFPKEAEAQRDG